MKVRIRVQWQVLVFVLVASTGCSSAWDGRVDGPLLTSVGSTDDAMGALIGGRLGYERECLLLGGMPVVWPEGTRWDSARRSLRLPDGDDVEVGAPLTGGGGYLPLAAIRDLFGEQVADAAKNCLGTTGEVVVFNPGSGVTPR
jgi:hypothetical protein